LDLDGSLSVNPKLPVWVRDAALKGLKLRGSSIDISAAGQEFTVEVGDRVFRSKIGTPVRVQVGDPATG
jgi:hypothetical protein